MEYKLKDTLSKDAFRYGYLTKKIAPFIKPHLARILLNILIAIPLGLLDGVVAFALKPYMDCVINGKSWTIGNFTLEQNILATAIPFGIVLFAVVQGVLKYANNYLTDWTGNKISNALKIELFNKLTSLDPKFYDINSSGLVLTRFFTDPETASKNIINTIRTFIMTIFGIVGLVSVLLYNSWKLAIIGVGIMAIAITPVVFLRKRIKKVSNATMVVGGDMTTNFNETFAGNKIMTAYNLQKLQNHKFEQQIKTQFNLTMSLTKRVGWMSPIMYFICSIGIAFVMFYGNSLIIKGEMTAGSFASFVTSLLLLYKPVKNLGRTLTDLQTTFVALGRVFELFDLTPHIENSQNAVKINALNTSIDFENVWFEYEKDIPVLKNFTLHVNKGETIALVGNSGGGKSTIVNLLPRFYDINSGVIKFDGTDIRNIDIETLRDNISFVFQDNFLFSGSIRENILMGKPTATEEEINTVIKMAHLDEFLSTLENGIDTY
ncbi:MAG: ABC transporter ATP-binding protein/permease, partial [Candidatus Gastranaerophilales bacterium]|nr:ABC transporter ATP-binding protein/permease [Candidatus Gastranaerophilales bacterium]